MQDKPMQKPNPALQRVRNSLCLSRRQLEGSLLSHRRRRFEAPRADDVTTRDDRRPQGKSAALSCRVCDESTADGRHLVITELRGGCDS